MSSESPPFMAVLPISACIIQSLSVLFTIVEGSNEMLAEVDVEEDVSTDGAQSPMGCVDEVFVIVMGGVVEEEDRE